MSIVKSLPAQELAKVVILLGGFVEGEGEGKTDLSVIGGADRFAHGL